MATSNSGHIRSRSRELPATWAKLQFWRQSRESCCQVRTQTAVIALALSRADITSQLSTEATGHRGFTSHDVIRNRTLLGAPGIAPRSKDTTVGSPYYQGTRTLRTEQRASLRREREATLLGTKGTGSRPHSGQSGPDRVEKTIENPAADRVGSAFPNRAGDASPTYRDLQFFMGLQHYPTQW